MYYICVCEWLHMWMFKSCVYPCCDGSWFIVYVYVQFIFYIFSALSVRWSYFYFLAYLCTTLASWNGILVWCYGLFYLPPYSDPSVSSYIQFLQPFCNLLKTTFVGVIVLTYLLNRIRVHKVGYKEQFVLVRFLENF